jgi:hypothetical protein
MNQNGGGSGGSDVKQLAALVERFRQASGSTSVDRAAKDQVLDQLQEAVGLSGKMVTEADILRRADKILKQ